jgi:hypothetical protein
VVKLRQVLPSSFILFSRAVCCDRMAFLNDSNSGVRVIDLLD